MNTAEMPAYHKDISSFEIARVFLFIFPYIAAPYGGVVGFSACVSVPDLNDLGDKHTILFDRVISNVGAGYHNHTGVFIAPAKGKNFKLLNCIRVFIK